MSRDGVCLSLLCCAAIILVMVPLGAAGPPEDANSRLVTLLAVQRALQEGRDQLQRGNFQAAVSILESQVSSINGDAEYLNVLRDAYRGYVRQLQQNNRTAELPVYARRLEILEPSAF